MERAYISPPTRRLGPPLPPVTHVRLILNWFEELKAKVPAGGAK